MFVSHDRSPLESDDDIDIDMSQNGTRMNNGINNKITDSESKNKKKSNADEFIIADVNSSLKHGHEIFELVANKVNGIHAREKQVMTQSDAKKAQDVCKVVLLKELNDILYHLSELGIQVKYADFHTYILSKILFHL